MLAARSGAAVQAGNRLAGYYGDPRPEIAALVPAARRRVLDVGCGFGALGRLLKSRGHHVTGVELVPEAAEHARQLLDQVTVADVETDGLPFAPGSFDVVILADVLEHLIDPWRTVRQAADLLAPGGCVVASVPNVQNIDVLRRLIRGRWDYRERGILDRGHLRFFTLRTLRRMFDEAGLQLTRTAAHYRRTWGRSLVSLVTVGRARAFLARRYLVVAERRAA
jgi:2-polyprenyl-3-methyl-5-hydroxy-6-metoxy-1,4-benzoquinol methylase